MATGEEKTRQVNDTGFSSKEQSAELQSEALEDPVAKIGYKPTVQRTLNGLISLIGVNSSVVCPWPNFYFVAALNLENGGTLGLLLGAVLACIGTIPVYLSLAEKMRKLVIGKCNRTGNGH